VELQNRNWGDKVLISRSQFSNISYKDILQKIFTNYDYQNYLEIGTNVGNSMQFAKNNCVGIDPNFIVKQDIITDKKSLMLFQVTSDEFFDGHAKNIYGDKTIDLAFIDGLHISDQVIRDFYNIVEYSSNEAIILLHDVVPRTYETSLKDRQTRFWTGDVWRACKVLMENYYNLHFVYLNCPPSGLLVVWSLDNEKINNDDIEITDLLNRAKEINDQSVSTFLKEIKYCESKLFVSMIDNKINFKKLSSGLNKLTYKKFRVKE